MRNSAQPLANAKPPNHESSRNSIALCCPLNDSADQSRENQARHESTESTLRRQVNLFPLASGRAARRVESSIGANTNFSSCINFCRRTSTPPMLHARARGEGRPETVSCKNRTYFPSPASSPASPSSKSVHDYISAEREANGSGPLTVVEQRGFRRLPSAPRSGINELGRKGWL